jgi:hypothetical protein
VKLFWATAVAGWLLIAWGIRGALHHHIDTRPAEMARFFVGGALIHDLVFAPLVLAAGFLVQRAVSRRWRAYVQGALIICGTVALFAYPEVRGYAHALNNPTSLPHNYTVNLAIVIALVCASTAILAAVRGRRRAG